MAVTNAQANALNHIQAGQVDATALQHYCNSFTLGPLKINYCIDPTVPQATFQISLAGAQIGSGTINAQNPSVTIGGSIAGFTAQVALTAAFSKSQLDYDITLCAPIAGCKQYTGTLFSW
ncbi:MAG TPA: hypothetical protein VMU84_12410 [Thermoanaerobaculia bacterium]|nr:hypothetical protein [Thermoanaerobaculia bacterium]